MENNFKIVGDIDHINETFNSMRQSHLNDPLPRYEIRIERLKKLLKAVENNENASKSILIFSILTKCPSKFLFNKLIPLMFTFPLK